MSALDLPVVDLRDCLDPARHPAFVQALGAALETWGFVAITGHGVPADLLADGYRLAAELFARPDAEKRRWEDPAIGRQRGYTGFGVEHARDHDVADLKEFWQIGRTLPPEHPLRVAGVLPVNKHPEHPAAFGPTVDRLYEAMDALANTLLGAIAEHIGLDAGALVDAVREGNSVLRVIHYPPIGPDAPEAAVRSAAHEDINLLTVLPASTQPGLEVLDKQGVWRPVQTPPDVMICDTGDIMQRLTGGLLPAVTHRVVNPPNSREVARYSMPFFCHPRPDWVIQPMRGEAAEITAGEFLRQRLIENGVLGG
jgi:isopenicillin N synthase-like dioxygenase